MLLIIEALFIVAALGQVSLCSSMNITDINTDEVIILISVAAGSQSCF